MTTRREHTPSRSIDDLYGLGSCFSVESVRAIVDNEVRIPIFPDPDYFNAEVVAEPDVMPLAQLARSLNDAAQEWGCNEREQTSASPKMRVARADQIAAKAAGLLAIMRGPDGKLLPSLGAGELWAQAALDGAESGSEAVDAVLSALDNLQRWATAMSARDTRDIRDDSGPSRQPDRAFRKLIGRLGGIYWQYWRRVPGLSRDSMRGGQPGGPFFRFVNAVLYELDDARPDEAIATAIARNEENALLSSAIAEWGEIGPEAG